PPPPGSLNPSFNATKRWPKSTIFYILRNRAYAGDLVYGTRDYRDYALGIGSIRRRPESEWTVAENTHEPIVSRDVFDRVQSEIKRRRRVEGSSRRRSEQK